MFEIVMTKVWVIQKYLFDLIAFGFNINSLITNYSHFNTCFSQYWPLKYSSLVIYWYSFFFHTLYTFLSRYLAFSLNWYLVFHFLNFSKKTKWSSGRSMVDTYYFENLLFLTVYLSFQFLLSHFHFWKVIFTFVFS